MKRQKFERYSIVKVTDNLPVGMSHFYSGFTGIVRGTYGQLYGGGDTNQYSLYVLEDGKIVNTLSWYQEDQLTFVAKGSMDTLKLVDKYLDQK